MSTLELKIPPPLVTALIAAAMWGAAYAGPYLALPSPLRVVGSIGLALLGVAISLAGMLAFRRARTTINPLKPESTTSIVSVGIYSFTRNPMYLGLAVTLLGWALYLSSVWALLGPLAFYLYIGRFQIAPEERVLSERFGAAYRDYCARVRRWL